ncbi:unnamed protein product, partial [Urochloa humidicola]
VHQSSLSLTLSLPPPPSLRSAAAVPSACLHRCRALRLPPPFLRYTRLDGGSVPVLARATAAPVARSGWGRAVGGGWARRDRQARPGDGVEGWGPGGAVQALSEENKRLCTELDAAALEV